MSDDLTHPAPLCGCGCGAPTTRIEFTHRRRGRVKGAFNRFLVGHHARIPSTMINRDGYRMITDCRGSWMFEHRIVAGRAMGHPLPKSAVVHHVNGDRLDNSPSNLVVCQDTAYHRLLHVRARALAATGNPDARQCKVCHQHDARENLVFYPSTSSGAHRACSVAADAARRAKRAVA